MIIHVHAITTTMICNSGKHFNFSWKPPNQPIFPVVWYNSCYNKCSVFLLFSGEACNFEDTSRALFQAWGRVCCSTARDNSLLSRVDGRYIYMYVYITCKRILFFERLKIGLFYIKESTDMQKPRYITDNIHELAF